MKLTELLQKAKIELKSVSHQAYQESLWILSHTLNLSFDQIYLEKNSITPKQEKEFWSKIKKRKQAIPLEYILKEKTFLNHKFYVEESVFIPRPETEILVEWVFKNITKDKALHFADFGSGAGAIALSILSHFPNSKGIAIELNPKSIKCLKKNSLSLNVKSRLHLLKKDISNIQSEDLHPDFLSAQQTDTNPNQDNRCLSKQKSNPVMTKLDLITANPPYIDPKDKSIQKEVYLYESPLALFSDKEGMGHISSWLKKALELLKPKGIYIFEFAWNQEKQITELLNSQTAIHSYQILKDQLGHPRIAVCFKKNSVF